MLEREPIPKESTAQSALKSIGRIGLLVLGLELMELASDVSPIIALAALTIGYLESKEV